MAMELKDFKERTQEKLDEALPWIGLYIAAASAVCTLAMAADAFNGIRYKKLWFPSKYFSLNATSLTLLSIAMKLTVNLNTDFLFTEEAYVKVGNLIFMSTAIGNFMPSLGSMNDKEILANVVALGILVITIAVNTWIQLIQLQDDLSIVYFSVFWGFTILMLLSLSTLVSLAITVPATKRTLETKYQEKHKIALREEAVVKRREAFRIDIQREEMKKYWVMAESSSPQFVIARSVVSTTSTVICSYAALIPVIPSMQWIKFIFDVPAWPTSSVYGKYIPWVIVIQATGVCVGTLVLMMRGFTALGSKSSTISCESFKKEFKIESYWIQTLVDWRDRFSALQVRHQKCRQYLHDAKWFTLTLCIGLQIFIVFVSKLLVLISTVLIYPFFLCCKCIYKIKIRYLCSNNHIGSESDEDTVLNLSRHVILLEGETELPKRILKNICYGADKVIQTGKKQQPQNLIILLSKFNNFNGVREFDSIQVPSLHSQDPPNCWTLPVVTLTTIAISLPKVVANQKAKQLMNSVSEGLSLAKLVDKTLDTNGQLLSIRNAADIAWGRVAFYDKWLDIDIRRTSLKCKNSKRMLEELSSTAERTISQFKREVKDPHMENPLNWPAQVIAANSMYRISRTVLLSYEGENQQTDEGLFEQISVMVADILAACFTNLANVITTMCHHNAIEKRGESVHKAFLLLGKTEKVLELLQQHEWPFLDHGQAACIEEWRALFQLQDTENPVDSASSSSNQTVESTASDGEQITVTVGNIDLNS